MEYRTDELKNFRIRATDGDIGTVEEVYFEDTSWIVRYVVVSTGPWLIGHTVLLSPVALGEPDPAEQVIPAALTREQVRNSPDPGTDLPLSRQHEHALNAYYGWPLSWGNPSLEPGFVPVPPIDLEPPSKERFMDKHLRSSAEVMGYRVHAADEDVGRMATILIDTPDWRISNFVVEVNTGGRHGVSRLVPPEKVGEIRLDERKVMIGLSRDEMLNGPEYSPSGPPVREYIGTGR